MLRKLLNPSRLSVAFQQWRPVSIFPLSGGFSFTPCCSSATLQHHYLSTITNHQQAGYDRCRHDLASASTVRVDGVNVAIESLRPARDRLKIEVWMNGIMKMMSLRDSISIWDTKMAARPIYRCWNIWTQIGLDVVRCEEDRSVIAVKRPASHQSLGGTLDSRVVLKDWNVNLAGEELRSTSRATGRLLSPIHGTTKVGTPIKFDVGEWLSGHGGVLGSFWWPKSVWVLTSNGLRVSKTNSNVFWTWFFARTNLMGSSSLLFRIWDLGGGLTISVLGSKNKDSQMSKKIADAQELCFDFLSKPPSPTVKGKERI